MKKLIVLIVVIGNMLYAGQTENLWNAVKKKNLSGAEVALNNGANPDWQDSTGTTALMIAVKNNDYDMTQLLIENGADMELTDKGTIKRDALTWACYKNRLEIVEMMHEEYDSRIDYSVYSDYGTPLMNAAMGNAVDVAEYLIKEGVDIKTETFGIVKKTALDFACMFNSKDIVRLFLNRKEYSNTKYEALDIAVENNAIDVVKVYLEVMPELVNRNYQYGYHGLVPILAIAIDKNSKEIVKILVENGAEKSNSGDSFFNYAKNADMRKLLISLGIKR